MKILKHNVRMHLLLKEIAKSGASGESADRMVQAMYNLSADEIEYMMERMMS